ncbi:hypothetical protein RSK20926_16297 [Roseobacter sp. SK209-2-6]|uniref:DUF5333 domain-containing protein n=1 Tax=Roseobacter sp. SK209-2-6 TaxID=388739 RepID=UPI0000F3CFC1|nr:DUF5333 domain-containing protein [Roseobacter sp. SK209-2-6]EBA15234.1 hypothetical protein RSK20926_16297 [Roseobacter sp. SK209-2-6]
MKHLWIAAIFVLGAVLHPQPLSAKPSLREVPEIEEPLFAVAVAKEIADHCSSIGARFFKGLGELRRLRARANELGYSDTEIRAYVESDQEKARMRAKGKVLFSQRGVSYKNPETFCVFGHTEIKKNSAIGVLLRAK